MSAPSTTMMKEPIHLLLLRGIVYAAALLTASWSVAGPWVNVAVVTTAVAGVVAGRQLAATRLRTWIIAVVCGESVHIGWFLGGAFGSSTWFAHWAGPSTALAVSQGITLCFGAFGLVVFVRVLALRRRIFAILEVMAGAAVVIGLFAGHRDFQIAQPRFLADWAFSTGRDPLTVLMTIGLGTLAAIAMLLLPRQRLLRTFAAVLALLLLIGGFCWFFPAPSGFAGDGSQASGFAPDDDKLNYDDRKSSTADQNQPVALVMFLDSFTPAFGLYHFRMQAFSQLANNRLAPPTLAGTDIDVPAEFPTGETPVVGNELPQNLGANVTTSVAMIVKQRMPAALVNPTALFPEVNPDPKYFVQVYGVRSRAMPQAQRRPLETAMFRAPAGNPAWSDAVRQHYLATPNDSRYKDLADRLIADRQKAGALPAKNALSPLDRGVTFLEWIRENTTYSLSPGNGNAPDPAADFLFGSKKGYCVHFATAMTYMLRSQGVPARVAGGYAAGLDRRGQGSSLLLQKSDAHAWCEIYLEGFGWVPLDGSPKKSDDPMPPPPSPEAKSFLQNKFEDKTNTQRTAELPKDDASFATDLFSQLRHSIVASILLMVASLYSVKVWRRLAPRFASARQLHRVAFRAALDRLAEVGFARQFGETREQFAERLAAIVPELSEATAQHLRRAMGGVAQPNRGQWFELQNQVCQRLAVKFGWGRRCLGLANPLSWIAVR